MNGNGIEQKTYENGVKVAVLEAAMKEVADELRDLNNLLRGALLGPGGICPNERAVNLAFRETARSHIRGLWAAMIFLASAYCGLVVVLIKVRVG